MLLPQAAKEQCLVVGRFIETPDGREIYFHRSSVLNSAFEHFKIGDEVILSEKAGDKGPHATSIRGKRLRKVLRRCSAGQITVHLRQGTGSAGLLLARLVKEDSLKKRTGFSTPNWTDLCRFTNTFAASVITNLTKC